MIVYLAGPITAIGREDAVKREDALRKALAEEGIITFAPANAWLVPGFVDHAGTQFVDDAAIAISDVIVATYTYLPSVPSKGTDHEVELAVSLNKPIVAFAPLSPKWGDGSVSACLTAYEERRDWLGKRGLDPYTPIVETIPALVDILAGWKRFWEVG